MKANPPSRRVILVGCGKSKDTVLRKARFLYTGSLFVARRQYAERSLCDWWIVSALHGLVNPDALLFPYDKRISTRSTIERSLWACQVVEELLTCIGKSQATIDGVSVELHMGEDYCRCLTPLLDAFEFHWSRPLVGLSQGKQLQWYSSRNERVT